MARKHNTPHSERGRSNYSDRLMCRGLSKSPAMESLDRLRERQEARIRNTGSPFPSYSQEEAA